MDRINVLLVEDEEVLAMVIKETLESREFDVAIAGNGVDGWSRFNLNKPDICVIDIMLPRKNGLSLVEDIRKVDQDIPLIFLTAKTQTDDVLKGLEAGADDYIKKPFSMEELILRIKKLVRRHNKAINVPVNIIDNSIGKYHFNEVRLTLAIHERVFNLSQRETDLIKLLIAHKNALLDRHTALICIWGEDNVFNARSMDVYISRLRKYLSGDPAIEIINVRGQGYKLVD
jgi:two-component system response regulator TrcR